MSLMIVTTPIRPYPTTFPPIGSLSIINYLRKHGVEDVEFYNIDGNRPAYKDVLAHIKSRSPDVLGISSVVSTAYAYTKQLSLDVKAMLPNTLIVVGGGLAASAEILLKKTGTDICVLGEGERVMLNIARRAEKTRDPDEFKDIPGLMILGKDGRLINTGYEAPIDREEIYDVDWDDLEKSSNIELFIFDAVKNDGEVFSWFAKDPRSKEPHRIGKKIASLPAAKGCVARCTFCHRWDKGIRYIPPALIMTRLESLIKRYNVGFLSIADENFGTDQRWLKDFCEKIKPYDVLWQVAGMRVNCVDKERLTMMRDAGCAAIAMGVETGSARMLQIMEKKVKIEDNYNAIRTAHESGIQLTPELIIGMPGETTETVMETSELICYASTISPERDPFQSSGNYAQALPGTPLYEFARRRGLIGPTIEDEEDYLLDISDKNAADFMCSLNLTNSPEFIRQSWRLQMQTRVSARFIKKYGRDIYLQKLLHHPNFVPFLKKIKSPSGNMIIDRGIDLLRTPGMTEGKAEIPSVWSLIRSRNYGLLVLLYPVFFDCFRFITPAKNLVRLILDQGIGPVLRDIYEHWFGSKRLTFKYGYKSLRKILEQDIPPLQTDSVEMAPLRKGR